MNCGWKDNPGSKMARCPFFEHQIESMSHLERITGLGRQSKVKLDLQKPPYGMCPNRFLIEAANKKKVKKRRIDVRVGWPDPPKPPHYHCPYLLLNDDPEKCFYPGYSGFVPRFEKQVGLTYRRATHEALNEFTDSMLPRQEHEEECRRIEIEERYANSDRCPKRTVPDEKLCHIGCSTERPYECADMT